MTHLLYELPLVTALTTLSHPYTQPVPFLLLLICIHLAMAPRRNPRYSDQELSVMVDEIIKVYA